MKNLFLYLLLILILNLSAKSQNLNTYTFCKGAHFSEPRKPSIVKMSTVVFYGAFTEQSKYWIFDNSTADGYSVDQMDWNKLCGVYINPTNTMDNTVMIAWRYNPYQPAIQIIPYWHRHKYGVAREMDEQYIQNISYNKPFKIILTFRNNTCDLVIQADTLVHELKQFPNGLFSRGLTIQPYFGGNQVAPNDCLVKLKME